MSVVHEPKNLPSDVAHPSGSLTTLFFQVLWTSPEIKTALSFRWKRDTAHCEHEVRIEAMGGNYTLCIFLKPVRGDPIVRDTYHRINISVFQNSNRSEDFSIDKLKLHFAVGHVIEETFASVSGYVLEESFYGTIYLKDVIHFLEPRRKKSKDLQILGDGKRTLMHR